MDSKSGHVMTLANSIIGVSILAMPYCFQQCGILLSICLLIVANGISRLTCHYLLKSAILSRRKTFEYLAFYTFGTVGKFFIEIGVIGFLLGSCIAFFVVMGDIGPEIIAEIAGTASTNTLRTSILMALALFCVLPLGLLRNVDSLNGVSKATVGFYVCLVLKIVVEALPQIYNGTWYNNVVWWQPAGILQCMPIFSMALSCQTQLFEIYHVLPNATLEKMNYIIGVAVNICTGVYICVGLFGYIAFFYKPFTGNILVSFNPSTLTTIMKIGFILSLAFSFPLVIFPCRASLYSLLFKGSYTIHDGVGNYIPEGKFKALTMTIVFSSLVVGIMIPNIELVLGLVGSTIGIMICILFPVTCFIRVSQKNTNERHLAQILLFLGIIVMILSTYANLYAMEKVTLKPKTDALIELKPIDLNLSKKDNNVLETPNLGKQDNLRNIGLKNSNENNNGNLKLDNVNTKIKSIEVSDAQLQQSNKDQSIKIDQKDIIIGKPDVRHEPPQPIEVENEEEVNNPQGKEIKNNQPLVVQEINNLQEQKAPHSKQQDVKHEPPLPIEEDAKEIAQQPPEVKQQEPIRDTDTVKKFVEGSHSNLQESKQNPPVLVDKKTHSYQQIKQNSQLNEGDHNEKNNGEESLQFKQQDKEKNKEMDPPITEKQASLSEQELNNNKLNAKENIKKSFDKIEEQIKDNIETIQKLAENDNKEINNNETHINNNLLKHDDANNKLIKDIDNQRKNDEVDIEAIKKEDKELLEQEKHKPKDSKIKDVLLDTIQKQNKVQRELVEQQKKILEVIENHENLKLNNIEHMNDEKFKPLQNIETNEKHIDNIHKTDGNGKTAAKIENKSSEPHSYKQGIDIQKMNISLLNNSNNYYPLPLVISKNKLKLDKNNNSNLTSMDNKISNTNDKNVEVIKTKPNLVKTAIESNRVQETQNSNIELPAKPESSGIKRDILSDKLNRTKREINDQENCNEKSEYKEVNVNLEKKNIVIENSKVNLTKQILVERKNEIEPLKNKIPSELLLDPNTDFSDSIANSLVVKSHTRDLKQYEEQSEE